MLLVKLRGRLAPIIGVDICAALLLLGARLGGRWRARSAAGPGPRGGDATPETTRRLPAAGADAGTESVGAAWAARNAHPGQYEAIQDVIEEPPLTKHRVRCSQ